MISLEERRRRLDVFFVSKFSPMELTALSYSISLILYLVPVRFPRNIYYITFILHLILHPEEQCLDQTLRFLDFTSWLMSTVTYLKLMPTQQVRSN